VWKASILAALGLHACLGASETPAWWKAFVGAPRVESRFVQESESAVFGKLARTGTLKLAKGGRLRVDYQKGLLLVADGATLVQYDPQARTAQKIDLRNAAKDAPLLWVLLDPGSLEQVFTVKASGPDAFTLEPRKKGMPQVTVEGKGGLPHRIRWIDPTGAHQVLELQAPTISPKAFEPSTFIFKAPAGTRWINN